MFQAKGLLLQPTTGYLISQPEWRWFEIFSLKLNRENTWLPAFLMCKAFFQLTCFPEMALWNQKQGNFALLGQKNFLFTYNDNSHNIIIHVWVNTLNLQGLVFTAAKFLLILIQTHFLKKWLNASQKLPYFKSLLLLPIKYRTKSQKEPGLHSRRLEERRGAQEGDMLSLPSHVSLSQPHSFLHPLLRSAC